MTDDLCRAVHEAARALPRVAYPFAGSDLPRDGICFFFEAGEYDAHTGDERIVRVSTHRNGNFRLRISEHYLLGKELDTVADRPAGSAPPAADGRVSAFSVRFALSCPSRQRWIGTRNSSGSPAEP